MSKFASKSTIARPTGLLTSKEVAFTYEGYKGNQKDAKTELFSLVVSRFVADDSFYEKADESLKRLRNVTKIVAIEDPAWLLQLIKYTRSVANMRTAPYIMAVEACTVRATNARQMIRVACQRDDEPAEALAYYMSNYGRKIPGVLKRGLADSILRLYSQFTVIKYDSKNHAMRPADVIDLVHPKPVGEVQSNLFKYMLDIRHNRVGPRGLELLHILNNVEKWKKNPTTPLPTGVTWEMLSTYTKMEAKDWEAVIPQMGYMALLRNLRNFDGANISREAQNYVTNFLQDPENVNRSKQLPFRFWSAYKNTNSLTYALAIERGLQESVNNIPTLSGRTLLMVDASGSMNGLMSNKSNITRGEAAAVFAGCVAVKNPTSLVCAYDYAENTVGFQTGPSVLRMIETIKSVHLGGGTETWPSTKVAWDHSGPFDRVIIFTDMQDHPTRGNDFIPKNVPVYVWDLAGYQVSNIETGSNRYLLSGMNDQMFKVMSLLENYKEDKWPWEI